MAVEQVAVQVLPFALGPIAPTRIKLWSRFAGLMSSDEEIDITANIYYGFWYDNHSFRMYDYLLPWVDGAVAGDMTSASNFVMWLTSLVDSLDCAVNMWSRVKRGLLGQVGDVSFPRHYKDVEQHVVSMTALRDEVRRFGVGVCQGFGFALPESFLVESTSPSVSAAGEGAESL